MGSVGAQDILARAKAALTGGEDVAAARLLRVGVTELVRARDFGGVDLLVPEARAIAASSRKRRARQQAHWALQIAGQAGGRARDPGPAHSPGELPVADATTAKVVELTATEAAFELAKSGRDVVINGRRDAVWRVRRDGVVEVARAQWGRVELYEVQDDGTSRIVATSSRSARKVASSICAYASGGSLVVGVFGAMAGSEGFAALIALAFVLFPLTFVLRWTSSVRSWVRARFGSDDDWADVPWWIEGAPTTGNQAVALAALADGRGLRYRVLDDGALEVVVRGAKQVDVLAIDRFGAATVRETLPSKRFTLEGLRGADVTWHEVFSTDPTD